MTELTIKERLMRLETQMKELLENHFPHLQEDMRSMKTQNSWILRALFVVMLGIIANLIIQ